MIRTSLLAEQLPNVTAVAVHCQMSLPDVTTRCHCRSSPLMTDETPLNYFYIIIIINQVLKD